MTEYLHVENSDERTRENDDCICTVFVAVLVTFTGKIVLISMIYFNTLVSFPSPVVIAIAIAILININYTINRWFVRVCLFLCSFLGLCVKS